MPDSIPLTVIGGFLGAGKTTLLNHWLSQSQGVRMAVLVNDFGAINLDAALVKGQSGDTIALSNGCVCCEIGNDLARAFIRVLDAQPPFEAIVIEASGVSDPWRIAELGRAVPELRLDGVIVLVDASAIATQLSDPLLADTVQRQLASADLVVANHCDLASPEEIQTMHEVLARAAPDVPVHETSNGVVPLPMLTSLALPGARYRTMPAAGSGSTRVHDRGHRHDHGHGAPEHGAQFDSWSCVPREDLALEQVRAWLADPPAGLLRLKGIIRVRSLPGEPAWYEIQIAGRHTTLLAAAAKPETGGLMVAIGLRGELPRAQLERQFGAH